MGVLNKRATTTCCQSRDHLLQMCMTKKQNLKKPEIKTIKLQKMTTHQKLMKYQGRFMVNKKNSKAKEQ